MLPPICLSTHYAHTRSTIVDEIERRGLKAIAHKKMQTDRIPVQSPLPSKLLVQYIERCLSAIPALKKALDRSDLKPLFVFGHQLRGTGGAYGIPVLTDIGSVIEQAALREDTDEVRLQVALLEEYLARVEIICNGFETG